MNRKIGMVSSIVNLCAVVGFFLCMLIKTNFGSYLTSMFIAFSFVPMICSFATFSDLKRRVSAYTAMAFSGIYLVLVLLVYFAQLTAVHLDYLDKQALQILDYQQFGLFFSYDLLGYSQMALATFFAGLTIVPETKTDRWLKWLLLIHGVFFISCFIMPMFGLFHPDMSGAAWVGTSILMFWCAYFVPIGILSFCYFKRKMVM